MNYQQQLEQLNRELLQALDELGDTLNEEGYSMAATQLDGLLDEYHADKEQIEYKHKEESK